MKSTVIILLFLLTLNSYSNEKSFTPPTFDLKKTSEFNPKVLMKAKKPIVDVKLISAQEADSILNPKDLVIGVQIDGEARAYPINMLT